MIRFIDLRGQIYLDDEEPKAEQEPVFAFYDTVMDQFVGWDQCFVWDSIEDFRADFCFFGGWRNDFLSRYLVLLPDWVPEAR